MLALNGRIARGRMRIERHRHENLERGVGEVQPRIEANILRPGSGEAEMVRPLP